MKDISYIILCWSLTLCMLWVLHKPPVQIVCANTEDVRLNMLSKVINAEFNPDDIDDAFLVGSTVLNRVELDGFPSTTDSVIMQGNQYYGVGTSLFHRTPISDSVAERLLMDCGRNYSVVYFYNRAANKQFKNKLKNNHNFIIETKSHKFFGQ